MAQMQRENQKITVQEHRISKFLELGWTLVDETPKTEPKPKKSKPKGKLKTASAVVTQTQTVSDDEHDFYQQNQGFIEDNLTNNEEK